MYHEHEILTTPDGEEVQIDKKMVNLIRAIWNSGLKTSACCEDVGPRYQLHFQNSNFEYYMPLAYVGFNEHEDILKFIKICLKARESFKEEYEKTIHHIIIDRNCVEFDIWQIPYLEKVFSNK